MRRLSDKERHIVTSALRLIRSANESGRWAAVRRTADIGRRSRASGLRATLKSQRCLAASTRGFVDINAMALNAAINGSIFALSDACLVMRMAFPIGSTPALVTAETLIYDLGGA